VKLCNSLLLERRLREWTTASELLCTVRERLSPLLLSLLNLFRERVLSKPSQGEPRCPVDDILHAVYELDWHVYCKALLDDPAESPFSFTLPLRCGRRDWDVNLRFTTRHHGIKRAVPYRLPALRHLAPFLIMLRCGPGLWAKSWAWAAQYNT